MSIDLKISGLIFYMEQKTSGNAVNSMNGYHYQRLYTILLILESFDNPEIKIVEEGIEDCDIYLATNNLVLNQIKYHNSNTKESITVDHPMQVLVNYKLFHNRSYYSPLLDY